MADKLQSGMDEELKSSLSKNLDDIFGINDGPLELTKSIEDKRKTVHTRSKELEELEQRIREAEERLRNVASVGSANFSSQGAALEASKSGAQDPPTRAPPQVPGRSSAA